MPAQNGIELSETLVPPLDPAAEAVAIHILRALRVPDRLKGYTPTHLAQDVGGSARSWERKFLQGEILGYKRPGGWVTTKEWLIRYLAENQNVVDERN